MPPLESDGRGLNDRETNNLQNSKEKVSVRAGRPGNRTSRISSTGRFGRLLRSSFEAAERDNSLDISRAGFWLDFGWEAGELLICFKGTPEITLLGSLPLTWFRSGNNDQSFHPLGRIWCLLLFTTPNLDMRGLTPQQFWAG
jgi:hypothetical protein